MAQGRQLGRGRPGLGRGIVIGLGRLTRPANRWWWAILVLGLLVATVRKLTEWLSTDALRFDFFLPGEGDETPLQHEHDLLETLLREQIANGTVGLLPAAILR